MPVEHSQILEGESRHLGPERDGGQLVPRDDVQQLDEP